MRGRTVAALLLAGTVVTGAGGGSAATLPRPGLLLLDEAFVRVAVAVPGFAGTWLEGDTLVVALTRPGNVTAARARRQLVHLLGRPDLAARPLAVRRARWSFPQLDGWHRAVSPLVLALPGSVMTGVDERDNVLRVGVTDVEQARPAVAAILAAYGVPPAAVVLEREDPVRPESSLRDAHVPVRGGLEIGYRIGDRGPFVCTYGFGAFRGLQAGFVVPSHCTATRGGTEGTTYSQPAVGPLIGSEWDDPPYFTGAGCPAGRSCRYSDAAFAITPFNVEGPRFDEVMSLGTIAKPNGAATAWNGRDVYAITAESPPLLGETVRKVGRTTGETAGPVSDTCSNYEVANVFAIAMLCQDRADYFSEPADSGSPVFTILSGTDVALRGMHWGSGGVFSSISGIQRNDELGSLRNCVSGAAC